MSILKAVEKTSDTKARIEEAAKHQAEVLSDKAVSYKLEEVFKDPDSYTPMKNMEYIKHPDALKKLFPDGIIWTVIESSNQDPFSMSYASKGGSDIGLKITVKSMPALYFAICAGDYKTAASLYRSKKYGKLSEMQPIRTFSVGKTKKRARKKECDSSDMDDLFPSGDFFSWDFNLSDNEWTELDIRDQSKKTGLYAHLDDEFSDLYIYVLDGLSYQNNPIPKSLALKLIEGLNGCSDKGWFDLEKVINSYLMGFRSDCERIDKLSSLIDFLGYMKKMNPDLYKELVTGRIWNYLTIKYANNNGYAMKPEDEEMISVLSDMYLDGFGTQDDLWEDFFDFFLSPANPFGFNCMMQCQYPLLGRIWKEATGKDLYFDVDLERLGDKIKEYNVSPVADEIPFPTTVLPEDVDESYEKITGLLINYLVKNVNGAIVRNGDPAKGLFDLKYIVCSLPEDMIIEALKKDFIRDCDAEDCIDICEKNNVKGIIPALILKKYGQWPAFDPQEF